MRHDRSFLLAGLRHRGSSVGGAATCHADLYYWSTNNQKFNQLRVDRIFRTGSVTERPVSDATRFPRFEPVSSSSN